MKEQALFFGLDCSDIPEVDGFLNDGDTFEMDSQLVRILHTPGHSPGSISIYFQKMSLSVMCCLKNPLVELIFMVEITRF